MKKILSFLIIFVLIFSLTSCDKNKTEEAPTPEVPVVTPTPTIPEIEYELIDSKTMVLGLGANGEFQAGYEYSTTNTDVIEITGNKYKTLKEGSAIVVVRQGENKIGVYVIAVYGEEAVELKDMTLTNQPTHLTIATVVKLEYVKDPINSNNYEAIVWESSNPEVATIDRYGNVTPLKQGEVTFTLTAVNTSVKKEFTFQVLPRETIFELNYSKIVGIAGSSEKVLETDILTDYSFDGNVTWYSNDEEVVKVSQDGTTTFVKPGNAKVGIKGVIDNKEISYETTVVVLEDMGYQVIRTPEALQAIGNASCNYMLGNDIDMKEAVSEGGSLYNNGMGFMPLFEDAKNSFKGTFDGNGFTIYNMYINRPNDVFVAFMRYISAEEDNEGVIKNLSFVGGEIIGGNYTSVFYSNASGYGSTLSGVKDSYVEMSLKSVGSLSCLVGNNKGLVENCIVNVTYDSLGDTYLFGLNHTGLEEGLGFKNCVFIGDYAELEYANLVNGGFVEGCNKITKEDIPTFQFKMGKNWVWSLGNLPVLKGVAYE